MVEPVNLNKRRKERAQREARALADANAVKFGRSKARKAAEHARAEQQRKLLDGHKRDDA